MCVCVCVGLIGLTQDVSEEQKRFASVRTGESRDVAVHLLPLALKESYATFLRSNIPKRQRMYFVEFCADIVNVCSNKKSIVFSR